MTRTPPTQGILNYSTSIAATKTAGEMQTMLARHGAHQVMLSYGDRGTPTGITFTLNTPHGPRSFELPCDVAAMQKTLQDHDRRGLLRTGAKSTRTSVEQAERVAWRVLKDWLASQLALIETQMVDLTEVMLPYLLRGDGKTLYEAYREHEARALPGGSDE